METEKKTIVYPFQARGAIAALFSCRAKEVLCVGPAGTGKTRGILEYIHHKATNHRNARILILRKTRASMTDTVLEIFESSVLTPRHEAREGPARIGRHSYRYRNGSEIVVGGLDNPDRIMSANYDMIAVFEATEATVDDWEKLTTRLRGPDPAPTEFRQIIADCNPAGPRHWLLKRAKRGYMTTLESRHQDNPLWAYCDPATGAAEWTRAGHEYLTQLSRLTGARKARLLFGSWAADEGAVFEETWDEAVHRVADVPRYGDGESGILWHCVGIDWGLKNPGVLGVWGIDADRRMYRVREIFREGQILAWWIRQMKFIKRDFSPRAWIGDSADPAKILECRKNSIPVLEAEKGPGSINTGIQKLEDRLRAAEDGQPRIFFVKNTVGWYDDKGKWVTRFDPKLLEDDEPCCTEDEFPLYAWPKDVDGKPSKEEPIDLYNNGIDMARYAINHVDKHSYAPRRIQSGARMSVVKDPNAF